MNKDMQVLNIYKIDPEFYCKDKHQLFLTPVRINWTTGKNILTHVRTEDKHQLR